MCKCIKYSLLIDTEKNKREKLTLFHVTHLSIIYIMSKFDMITITLFAFIKKKNDNIDRLLFIYVCI